MTAEGNVSSDVAAGSPEQVVTAGIAGASADRGMRRALAIFKDRVERRCAVQVRITDASPRITLATAGDLPAEGFRIESVGQEVRIVGGSARGLLYGVGKFLRTSRYDNGFTPSPWRGTSVPQGTLRGMYFASHFHNWYHVATEEELVRYVEDLALWGINTLMVIYPLINLRGWDDPEAVPAMAQFRKLLKAAKDVGLDTATGANNNLFTGTPAELRAAPLPDPLNRRGNFGANICPSQPAGRELILATVHALLAQVADIGVDYLCFWPYDEGGCACDRCRPWGANGFLRLSRDLAAVGRQLFPRLKVILATWTFDTPPEGEWDGLARALAADPGWVDYILADAHDDFPRYPLEAGVPGKLPLINFPEISMWGNWPWGGYGAHVLPARFQRLWDQAKHLLQGGFPYSEGIYEDMLKVVVVQFYWDRERTAWDTLREYAAYEFGPEAVADVLAIIEQLETAATRATRGEAVDAEGVLRAAARAESVAASLPDWARHGWRWQILRLRTILDRERFAGAGLETPFAEAALRRLISIYHARLDDTDPYHHRVRPPLKIARREAGGKADVTVYADPADYASFPQLVRTDRELVLLFQVQELEKLRAISEHPHYQKVAAPRWASSRDSGMTWELQRDCPPLGKVLDASYGSAPLADGGTVTLTFSGAPPVKAVLQHGRIGYRPYQDESASGAAADIRLISDLGPFRHFYPHGTTRTGGGEIIVAGYAPLGPSPSGAPDARTTAVFLCSGDEGRTWHYLSHLPNPFRFSLEEPAVLEVAPGRLITLLRTGWDPVPVEQRPAEARTGYGYFLYQSASRDGGRSWTKPVPLPLWGHPPHLTRLASGNILLVYGHRRPPYEIRAVLSRDHGRSWDLDTLRTVRTFAPGDYDIGYPVATQLADGAIVCAYYGYASPEIGEKMPHGIFVNVFDEQWLAACRT